MARNDRHAEAYDIVDVKAFRPRVRDELVADALGGGLQYGLRIVEQQINGAARVNVFGVYKHESDKWEAALKELGVQDAEVEQASDVDEDDVRNQARAEVDGVATNIRQREEASLEKVVEKQGDSTPQDRRRAAAEKAKDKAA